MERLTKRIGSSISYSDFNENNSDSCYESMDNCLHKLAEYEDAEEQGLLLKLPCKVGDVVYFPKYDYHDSAIVTQIEIIYKQGITFYWSQYEHGVDTTELWDDGYFSIDEIGETVFITREEAKQALQKMKEGAE